jgi:hypothetical protein
MTLNYDFDVYSEIPRGIFSEKTKTRPASEVKDHSYWEGHKVAMFRDPKTAKAFHTAPQKIRDIFLDANFSSGRSYSRVPKGYYLETDHEFRTQVFEKLEENLASELTEGELSVVLSTKEIAPKQKKYAFHNRLKSTGKTDIDLNTDGVFNVGAFINAAYDAKSVAVPKMIKEQLTTQDNTTTTSKRSAFAFFGAAVPRLAFMFYLFVFSTIQVNAATLFGF